MGTEQALGFLQCKKNMILLSRKFLRYKKVKSSVRCLSTKWGRLRDISVERRDGEGTVGFHQTVQDVREHISRCVFSLIVSQPHSYPPHILPQNLCLFSSLWFTPTSIFTQAFMYPPWECFVSSYSSPKSPFNLLACWGKGKGSRRRGNWLGLIACCKGVRMQWSKIQGFLLPLLSFVISGVVLQKRFVACSRDLAVLYISLLPLSACLHTSP